MSDAQTPGLTDAILHWVAGFTGIDLGKPGNGAKPAQADGPAPVPAPASADDPAGKPADKGDKVPRPMPPGLKLLHGKVPGPKNHVLTDPDGFVVDTEAKTIIANSLDDYKKAHAAKGKGGSGDSPTPTDGPLSPGDSVIVGGNNYVIFEDEIRIGGTVSWHARNPGNIRNGDKYGAYAGKRIHTSSAGSFAIFPDEDTGLAAIAKVLKGYGKITVKQAMNKYAPSGDGANDPDQYARMVAKAMGAEMDTGLDTLSDGQMTKFAEKIKQVEGWKPGTAFKRDDPKVPEEIRKRLGQ
jgi:hypothetical protein